ncbi:hypothetical protein [Chryseobacterium sp. MFBS3-17]|uniref:hypothetical protein n=1 Tax=Chryseobacterium sp. MFBS3-17 TaxID=2886689 RepID=UPI001D0ECBE9|nr:hypothetical protein [Chryseobacterium sp. MFBS3-17]MCC2590591.1 hypothetical protein [Chryseobacterium sp. MFBS3-17]
MTHNFHIPVMGLAFTIDSPARVAQYGIDSVISIMDDDLIEKMTALYARNFKQPYEEITKKAEDFRAKRITNYLNLLDKVVTEKFNSFKQEITTNKLKFEDFLSTLPSNSELKEKLENVITTQKNNIQEVKKLLDQYFHPGSIDVNIMTKVDKDNFEKGEQLPVMYNDAHAALRGFALSTVQSAVVFSAGMNPRLYSYLETFDNFYPDAEGRFQKKIILKVSDFRSAMIQGNFLAKKGLWVSEYRIESGLNCGGHAFATEGLLMGPIVEEFRNQKNELEQSAFSLFTKALDAKDKTIPATAPEIKITVQGGVGTAEEHQFLLSHYQVDSVGWGSPFLLVPEATSVDQQTRSLLARAGEEDLYLSNISPLGVPFNTVKGTTNEFHKNNRIAAGKAGSSCPKKYLALSKDHDPEGICTASKKYQDLKIQELKAKTDLTPEEYSRGHAEITEKACLCVGLANASHLEMGIPVKGQQQGVVVCPGPNMAYFSNEVSLKDMMKHIYGEKPVENHSNRPHMFIKELYLYIDHLQQQIQSSLQLTPQKIKKLEAFKNNLLDGISYYRELFSVTTFFRNENGKIQSELNVCEAQVKNMKVTPELV